MALSLNPSTYVEGGFLDNVDVRVTEAVFAMYDYDGKTDDGKAKPTLYLQLTDSTGKAHDQYFSAGNDTDIAPSVDGTTSAVQGGFLVPLGGKTGLSSSCNTAKFLTSLINAGFPADKLDGSISGLVGLEFHLIREAVKRQGLIRSGKNAQREQTVMTVQKIHKLPWEPETKAVVGKSQAVNGVAKPATVPSTATVGSAQSAISSQPSGDVAELAASSALEILLEADGNKLPKAKLGTMLFQKLKGNPSAAAASKLMLSDAFLNGRPEFKFDGAIVEMA